VTFRPEPESVGIMLAIPNGVNPIGVDGHGRAKYYLNASRGARPEKGGLRSNPLNLIRIMPAQGSQRDARLANAVARFFILRSCAWN